MSNVYYVKPLLQFNTARKTLRKGCFDEISHGWLLANIPINKRILNQWLKAGYFEQQQLFQTNSGTPQGSIISPTLANMVLDGMETVIDLALDIHRARNEQQNHNPYRVHLIRYADDFIVTASDKSMLEEKVKPAIEAFLAQRGLKLSQEKTIISHISDGFDFLGKNIRKFDNKLIIRPSKKNIKAFLLKVKTVTKLFRAAKTVDLIKRLNPIIRGWTRYHRMDNLPGRQSSNHQTSSYKGYSQSI